MKFNSPTKYTFIVFLALFALAFIGNFVNIPFITNYRFIISMVANILLGASCLIAGL